MALTTKGLVDSYWHVHSRRLLPLYISFRRENALATFWSFPSGGPWSMRDSTKVITMMTITTSTSTCMTIPTMLTNHATTTKFPPQTFCFYRVSSSTSPRLFSKKVNPIAESNQPLVNEKLVAALMKQSNAVSADTLQVRLIVETKKKIEAGGEAPSKPVIVSLTEAIKTSIEMEQDLIAISINQDVPVVKVANLQSILYHSKRKSSSGKPALETKEFRFKAGIADGDLDRKIESITSALERGHSCAVTVICRSRLAANQPGTLQGFTDQILHILSDSVELIKPVESNPEKTRAKFSLRASDKLTKSSKNGSD